MQKNNRVVSIDGYVDVSSSDEDQLLRAVASQPVSVGICGSERTFQSYSKVTGNSTMVKGLEKRGSTTKFGGWNSFIEAWNL
ncbi:hypothetical protein GIB67_001376 [Kingdonia uniflora]|uniref:Peptidase C1A papain C-terminal domain-containing protein n=1 Tax=Kingdonia uniflora TaxID=39325 RepID=A0A7J7N827_9MAGN|nr:hypothetical protein GIB67_001376 [Kingdonia uniflora]